MEIDDFLAETLNNKAYRRRKTPVEIVGRVAFYALNNLANFGFYTSAQAQHNPEGKPPDIDASPRTCRLMGAAVLTTVIVPVANYACDKVTGVSMVCAIKELVS